jgi:sarcosine/dimethylglycine N-methyltransferase
MNMSNETITNAVTQFYDSHPINEDQILHALRQSGCDLANLTQDDLSPHDQDHYGGIEANSILASKAGITQSSQVLDICSGLGGPARWLAHHIGCHVTGLEVTESRCQAAGRLTELVALDHKVEFRRGNALAMPFAEATFDVAVSQEAFVHVPDKPGLISECARVIKSNGRIAFTDIVQRARLDEFQLARLREEMAYPSLETTAGYCELLQDSGFDDIQVEDLSDEWAHILVARLAMYRSLRVSTVAKFGEGRGESWDRAYSFFVGLYETGHLGGVRLIARRVR